MVITTLNDTVAISNFAFKHVLKLVFSLKFLKFAPVKIMLITKYHLRCSGLDQSRRNRSLRQYSHGCNVMTVALHLMA